MAFDFNLLLQKIDEIDTLTRTNWSGDEDLYNKLILIKPLCDNRLKSIYASLLHQDDISRLQNQLDTLASHVRTYKSGNSNYSTHIISTINIIMPIIAKIPFAGKGETPVTLSKIIEDFGIRNAEIIKKITEEKEVLALEITSLKQTIATLSSEIAKQQTKAETLINDFQSKFLEAQERRSSEFSIAQRTREEEFLEGGKIFLAQFDKKEAERTNSFVSQAKEFSEAAEKTLTQMQGIEDNIRKIYNIVGEISQTGLQKQYANNAKEMANRLFGGAIVIMFFVIGITIYPIFDTLSLDHLKQFDWTIFLYRLPLAIAFLLPAFYMANESSKHREKEGIYRELEIKLQNIRPYFNEITDDEKEKVQLELGKMLLSPSKQKSDKNVVLPPEVVRFMEMLVKLTGRNK